MFVNRRVVITGMGLLTPLGNNVAENWQGILEARNGIGPVTGFDASQLTTRIAGEVRNFDPTTAMEKKEVRRYDRFIHLGMAAAQEAITDSGLQLTPELGEQTAVITASGIGGLGTLADNSLILDKQGPSRISPFFIPASIINMLPGLISIRWGLQGPNYGVVSACASSGHAIGDAFHLIKRGECTVAITGGAEAAVTPLGMAGFCSSRAMSTRNDEPETASRPFSAGRDGFVLSEGAAILVLEELEHAVARGARIYAEVISIGASGDAHHITAPHPEGVGAMKAMRDALKWAGVQPEQVDYINAHGTSTELGDVAETSAVKGSFGEHAYKLAMSSTKSMTGHMLGAAGGAEAAYTALALYHQVLPPTRNLNDPDPACDLDYVPNQARPAKLTVAMSNSFGFGGTNSSLLLRRYQ